MGRWAAIVGAEVAAHAEPVAFDDGELVVSADSTAWATQIRLLAPTLLPGWPRSSAPARSRAVDGPRAVGAVLEEGPPAVRGRGPRDTYG